MDIGNPIEAMASAIYSATIRDLPDIEYEYRKPGTGPDWESENRKRRPDAGRDIEAVQFSQTWGSTVLGFGGVGGASMTSAYVTVVHCMRAQASAVYFAGRFAYLIKKPHRIFYDDIRTNSMADVSKAHSRYKSP